MSTNANGLLAAVDVGGTFIDVVLADPARRTMRIDKVLHRPGQQGRDIIDALTSLAATMERPLADLAAVVVGTTVVTNALLENRLGRTALVTTDGFRDVLEIARMTRASSYDLHKRRAPVVVPRERRLEVPERLDHDGNVLRPLDEAALARVVEALREEKPDAVAVCLLYSFVSPEHEKRVAESLAPLGVPLSLSSEVLPVFREYERATATALNAATMPIMAAFLEGLESLGADVGGRCFIMGSAGGSMTRSEARRFPIKCAMSGPAGGVVAARQLAELHELDLVLTLDVGGTSSDVAFLREGRIAITDERRIGGYPVAVASAEIETIGAGGGSIAHLDKAGLLKVGPQSAGASPGPVCYRRGGTEPTVTDAHLALNRLSPSGMLGGSFALDREAAIRAIEEKVAAPLGVSWQRAAHGILQVTTANMVRAVRTMSVERGQDPRRATLVAFGGAGPLHAIDVARALDIPQVLVPFYTGVFSAHGILSVDISYDTQRTWLHDLAAVAQEDLAAITGEMRAGLLVRAAADGLDPARLHEDWSLDLRYRGQSYALTVALPGLDLTGLAAARRAFLAEHRARYGHASDTLAVELLNLRLRVSEPSAVNMGVEPGPAVSGGPLGARRVHFAEDDIAECPVYQRTDLAEGWIGCGPLIVEQFDSVTVLGRGDTVEVLPGSRALLVTIRSQQGPEAALPEGESHEA
ncbi:hydantoinase/oxoprolinase family protein [Ancylobacter mangrovi]|uniref:hydantoinase/oxoprolinase family protein n=1 Tax=Ancylobacter mangrovi TaxID=2972472 RepID=UPI002161E8D0|nr:hydantoinase/oxoprolinase family protein [Ancylobacter mangrovi]MCS0502163.1 hydantoinase/oxoprolinase family protein [Ancylobacter mangrovi]